MEMDAEIHAGGESMQVTLIEEQGRAALVEWNDIGGEHRVIVPRQAIGADGSVSGDDLAAGIPYGVAWERLVLLADDLPYRIASALHRRGIWTIDDLEQNLEAARVALQEAYGFGLKNLLDGARAIREEKEND